MLRRPRGAGLGCNSGQLARDLDQQAYTLIKLQVRILPPAVACVFILPPTVACVWAMRIIPHGCEYVAPRRATLSEHCGYCSATLGSGGPTGLMFKRYLHLQQPACAPPGHPPWDQLPLITAVGGSSCRVQGLQLYVAVASVPAAAGCPRIDRATRDRPW